MPKLQLATAVGIILFWMAFFTIGFESPAYPSYYTKFEHSFPLPDAFFVANAHTRLFKKKYD